ncbi:MAG: hypothetical protein L6265_05015 [Thermoplasmatales archaeon]|nr:hypothetical protein [Thermoplasmatales archaeon]
MNCLKNRDVFLYDEPLCRNLNLHEIKDYLKKKINVRVEVRKEFISCYFKQEKVEDFAKKMAEIRVKDLRRNTFFEPLYGEVKYEERMLKKPKNCSVMYDGFKLQALLRGFMTHEEYKHVHIVFTNRLFGTFDENDMRYHARVIICGHPSLISTSGIVEAPAKPKEFYYLKQKSAILGIPIEVVKEKFKGRFIDYDDERITEVMKGYVMQALMYNITGEPFCNDRNCRLFNAHWQEDVLNAQLNGKDFCIQHEKILEQHRTRKLFQRNQRKVFDSQETGSFLFSPKLQSNFVECREGITFPTIKKGCVHDDRKFEE